MQTHLDSHENRTLLKALRAAVDRYVSSAEMCEAMAESDRNSAFVAPLRELAGTFRKQAQDTSLLADRLRAVIEGGDYIEFNEGP